MKTSLLIVLLFLSTLVCKAQGQASLFSQQTLTNVDQPGWQTALSISGTNGPVQNGTNLGIVTPQGYYGYVSGYSNINTNLVPFMGVPTIVVSWLVSNLQGNIMFTNSTTNFVTPIAYTNNTGYAGLYTAFISLTVGNGGSQQALSLAVQYSNAASTHLYSSNIFTTTVQSFAGNPMSVTWNQLLYPGDAFWFTTYRGGAGSNTIAYTLMRMQ